MERNYVVMACKEFEKENVQYAFDLWQSNPEIDMRKSKTRESIIGILREIYKSKEHIISFKAFRQLPPFRQRSLWLVFSWQRTVHDDRFWRSA